MSEKHDISLSHSSSTQQVSPTKKLKRSYNDDDDDNKTPLITDSATTTTLNQVYVVLQSNRNIVDKDDDDNDSLEHICLQTFLSSENAYKYALKVWLSDGDMLKWIIRYREQKRKRSNSQPNKTAITTTTPSTIDKLDEDVWVSIRMNRWENMIICESSPLSFLSKLKTPTDDIQINYKQALQTWETRIQKRLAQLISPNRLDIFKIAFELLKTFESLSNITPFEFRIVPQLIE